MKLLLPLICILALQASAQSGRDIVIGKRDTLFSHILNEKRGILIHLPHDGNNPFTSVRYPVVYLLDGDAHFPSVEGLIQQLTEVNGNTAFPEMIIVGIPNTDRQRDLTPTHVKTSIFGDSNSVRTSGGGENFTAFIEKELIPHIDSLYPTAPYRIMIGHSLGGLMVINTLIHHPQLFNSYIAIDPSMWWDDRKLLKEAEVALAHEKFTGKTLYMGVANTMPDGMDTAKVRKDTTNNTLHIRSILRLAAAIKKNKSNGLRFRYRYYPDDSHGTVPLITEYDGLRFMFDFYSFRGFDRLVNKDIPADSAIVLFKTRFRALSENMGYTILPPEDMVNSLGYYFLQSNQPAKSFAFFKMNTENYPKSGNTFDSLGDYYSSAGDREKAIEAYAKCLTLWDNPDTRKKLEEQKAKNH
ncbi:alpha/beta hydrolase-fold protein [Puia dinghuensis]|uniref:Periplasmic siderophore cleavage esterase IroE family protein n=1 Tax=Puia dinghuensis TaxID=1792502 RepID=A0A8J2XTE6_9BACT|nr:alpha/beta hydrolase-fold protein [Puia dinghuensis]GGB02851.1 periplasmic siderophore cleavage esterase IroE family protein [Puia dinghuensis]